MRHVPQRIQRIARVKRGGLVVRIREAVVMVALGAIQSPLQVLGVPGARQTSQAGNTPPQPRNLPRSVIDHARVALVRPRRRRLGDEAAEVGDSPLSTVVTGELAVALSLGQTLGSRHQQLALPTFCLRLWHSKHDTAGLICPLMVDGAGVQCPAVRTIGDAQLRWGLGGHRLPCHSARARRRSTHSAAGSPG